jgi:hypothetical protein
MSKLLSPGQPIKLIIQKSWPFRWHITVSLYDGANHPILIFDDQQIKFIAQGLSVNYDDKAFELVGPDNSVKFQLIWDEDSDLYMNAVLSNPDGSQALIMNGERLQMGSLSSAKQPIDIPQRMFKYPAYEHRGERL